MENKNTSDAAAEKELGDAKPDVIESSEDSDCSVSSYESNSSPSDSEDGEEELVQDTQQFTSQLLNFRSVHFNPSLALMFDKNDPNLQVPDRNAPTYLNLVHWSKAVADPVEDSTKLNKSASKANASSVSNNSAPLLYQPKAKRTGQGVGGQQLQTMERRFLPHQLPVFKPRKKPPNVITIMENVEGPLGALSEAMKEQRKVKVWTRNDTGIRGFVTGFVEAFDKHWNLALRDVDEHFLRRRKIKYPAGIFSHARKPKNDNKKEKKRDTRRRSPRIRAYSAERKSQSRSRRSRSRGSESVRKDRSTSPLILRTSNDLVSACREELSQLNLNKKSKRVVRSRSESKGSRGRSLSKKRASSSSRIHSSITKSAVRKNRVVVFKVPKQDANGFRVVAQTKKHEVVERHVGQLFLLGNDIVFIETGR